MGLLQQLFRGSKHLDSAVIPDSPPLKDEAWAFPSFFAGQSPQILWNWDHLQTHHGWWIYNEMLEDEQVKAAVMTIIDLITGHDFRFVVEDETQEQAAEFFKFTAEKTIQGTFREAMSQILFSKVHGFSINEIGLKTGQWEDRDVWILRSIRKKPSHTFKFSVDAFGNIHDLVQDQLSKEVKLNPAKFIIHLSNKAQDQIYGRSDLIPAYKHYWSKRNLLRFWDIHLERLAGGFVVLKPNADPATLSPSQVTNLDNAISNLAAQTSIRLPKGYDIEVIQSSAAQDFDRAIDSKNIAIARALMVPNLVGITPQGQTGSFAQAKIHQEIFLQTLNREAGSLADSLNEQLWARLAWWNFGIEDFPRMQFDPMSDAQKEIAVKAFVNAVKGQVIKVVTDEDENRTRGLLGYEERDPEEDPEQVDDVEDVEEETVAREDIAASQADEIKSQGNGIKFQQQPSRNQFPWRERVDFAEIQVGLDEQQAQFSEDVAVEVDIMWSSIQSGIGPILTEFGKDRSLDPVDMEAAVAKLISEDMRRSLKRVIQANLQRNYSSGRQEAIKEVEKAANSLEQPLGVRVAQSAVVAPRFAARKPMTDDGLVIGWVRAFVDGIGLDTAERYFNTKGFKLGGDLSSILQDQATTMVISALRDEKTTQEMIEELTILLKPYIGERDALGRRVNIGARIETMVRTNMTEAFNQARLSVYNASDIGDFVEAYEYDATIDSRTTPFCRAANGKIYAKDDEFWTTGTPPNHFNCRSIIIPVTQFDDHEISSALPPDVQPDAGFGKVS